MSMYSKRPNKRTRKLVKTNPKDSDDENKRDSTPLHSGTNESDTHCRIEAVVPLYFQPHNDNDDGERVNVDLMISNTFRDYLPESFDPIHLFRSWFDLHDRFSINYRLFSRAELALMAVMTSFCSGICMCGGGGKNRDCQACSMYPKDVRKLVSKLSALTRVERMMLVMFTCKMVLDVFEECTEGMVSIQKYQFLIGHIQKNWFESFALSENQEAGQEGEEPSVWFDVDVKRYQTFRWVLVEFLLFALDPTRTFEYPYFVPRYDVSDTGPTWSNQNATWINTETKFIYIIGNALNRPIRYLEDFRPLQPTFVQDWR